MGEEKDNKYYDKIFKKFQHYSLSVDGYNSPWFHIYKMILNMLNKNEKILEIGCGTGQFADILMRENYNYVYGFDFSEQAVIMSKERCKKDIFQQKNLYTFDFTTIDFDTAISVEVFEHIKDDLEVIKNFPKGKRLIFSVPTYDAGGHIRFYPKKDNVINRFQSQFSNFDVSESKGIFLINAIK